MLHLLDDGADVADRFDDIAGAGFALGPDHRGAFGDAAQSFAQIARSADERDLVSLLIDVVLFVGGREHFALVDIIDAQRFEDPSLHEVADARLGHHRDGNGVHDLADDADRGHARDAAFFADVGRNALQRHDGGGAGLFGDLGLLDVGHVHNDPALEHFGQADF